MIFIDAVNEVTSERARRFLKYEHQRRILNECKIFADEPGFAKVATLAEISVNAGNFSLPLHVKRIASTDSNSDVVCAQLRANGKQMESVLATDEWIGGSAG